MTRRLSRMRPLGPALVLAGLGLGGPLARAQEEEPGPPAVTKATYPRSFVERPLLLPTWLVQPATQFVASWEDLPAGGSRKTAVWGYAADLGLPAGLQTGAAVNFEVYPEVDFGSVRANLQYPVVEQLSGRLDVGMRKDRVVVLDPRTQTTSTVTQYALVGGLSLGYKHLLSSRLALTSGRTDAFGYGDDLLTWDFNSTRNTGTFGIPLGLLAQLTRSLALELRSGFRLLVSTDAPLEYLPVRLDVLLCPWRRLDLGAAFELPGETQHYADVRNAFAWIRMRF